MLLHVLNEVITSLKKARSCEEGGDGCKSFHVETALASLEIMISSVSDGVLDTKKETAHDCKWQDLYVPANVEIFKLIAEIKRLKA